MEHYETSAKIELFAIAALTVLILIIKLTHTRDRPIIKHKGRYYLSYKIYGPRLVKPWRLVTQPGNEEVDLFETEDKLCEYIETL